MHTLLRLGIRHVLRIAYADIIYIQRSILSPQYIPALSCQCLAMASMTPGSN
jgi:hypothetical protein